MTSLVRARTQAHYDEYPFIEGGPNRVAWWRKYLMEWLPDSNIAGRLILDDGCSIGEISRGLIDRGARLVCLDVSARSLRRCRQINPEAQTFHGDALALPFADESFDHTISIGVLHHTPDCRRGFAELARVTRPGGAMIVFLYNWWNIYHLIYRVCAPLRWAVPLARIPRWLLQALQPFVRSHLGQRLNDDQLRHLLGDKLWTPRATFHSARQVYRWASEEGLERVDRRRFFLGYANVFCFRKRGMTASVERCEPIVKCIGCGHAPMNRSEGGYVCATCGYAYAADGGLYEAMKAA